MESSDLLFKFFSSLKGIVPLQGGPRPEELALFAAAEEVLGKPLPNDPTELAMHAMELVNHNQSLQVKGG